MPRIKINTVDVINSTPQAHSAQSIVSGVASGITSTRWRTDGRILGRNGIDARLGSIQKQVVQIERDICKIYQTAEGGATYYQATERRIIGLVRLLSSINPTQENSRNENPYSIYFKEGTVRNSDISDSLKDMFKIEKAGSILNASANASAEKIEGKGSASASASASVATGNVEADVLDGIIKVTGTGTALSAEAMAGAGYDVTAGNLAALAKAEASAYELKGELELEALWGLEKFKASGEVNSIAVSAKACASLLKDGMVRPALDMEAEASAAVAKGELEQTLGVDYLNVQAKAEGYAFGAEANAEAKIGWIQEDDGETSYGVAADVGAEAYLAKGEVSGGVNLFGIEIMTKAGGGLGGAEFSAGGHISTKSLGLSIGIGLLLGVDAEISIDWSDFELWEDK